MFIWLVGMAYARQQHLSPQVLGPPEFEDQGGEEDEEVLEEEGDPRVHGVRVEGLLCLVVNHDVLAEQDPAGTQQGSETKRPLTLAPTSKQVVNVNYTKLIRTLMGLRPKI